MIGIYDFIQLTTVPVSFQEDMVLGALMTWSSHCKSFILPVGPMSITLRDIMALTHLPVLGSPVPCTVEEAFPDFEPLDVPKNGNNYSKYISHFSKHSLEVNPNRNHIHFLWVLVCKYIFFPSCCHPTQDYLVIAKHLALKKPIGLAKMLLGSIYHNLYLTVTKEPFTRLNGCVWMVQLWLFAYFPSLRSNCLPPGDPILSEFAGIRMSRYVCDLDFVDIMSFFYNLKMSVQDLLVFVENPVDLPPSARRFSSVKLEPVGIHTWTQFIRPIFLHVGIGSKEQKLGTGVFPCFEGYNPSLWCRQLGFTQLRTAIPKEMFPEGQQRLKVTKEEAEKRHTYDTGPWALEDFSMRCGHSMEHFHVEFEKHWGPRFDLLFKYDPKGKQNPDILYCLPPISLKRKAATKKAPSGATKKAKKNALVESYKPKVTPTRKSGRLTASIGKKKKVITTSIEINEDSEPSEGSKTESEGKAEVSDGEGSDDAASNLSDSEEEQQMANDGAMVEEKEDANKTDRAADGTLSGYLPSQETTEPSENPSSSAGFSVKVNYSESPFLNYQAGSYHTPPFQDSVSVAAAPRPELDTLVNPVRSLDLSFFAKRRSSSPSCPMPSDISIQLAKETITKCLAMDLSLLDLGQLEGLKSALTLLSSSCQARESRQLLSTLATKVSLCFEYLNSGTKELLALENQVQAYMMEVSEAENMENEAIARKALDKAELEKYEVTQKQIKELDEQVTLLRKQLAEIEDKRAAYALEKAEAKLGIKKKFDTLEAQFEQAKEWEARIEEIKVQRNDMLKTWDDLRAIDLSLVK